MKEYKNNGEVSFLNKKTTTIILIVLLVTLCIGLVKIMGDNNTKSNESGDTLSGEFVDSGENIQAYEPVYNLTRNENEIIITSETSGDLLTMKYVYEDEKLKDILIVEEVYSEDIAKQIYDTISKDEEMKQIYDTVEISGKVITYTVKQEVIDVYAVYTMDELYTIQENSLNSNY